jgi:hypothetical protein
MVIAPVALYATEGADSITATELHDGENRDGGHTRSGVAQVRKHFADSIAVTL